MKRNNKQRSTTSDGKQNKRQNNSVNKQKRKGPKRTDHFDKYRATVDDYLKPKKGGQNDDEDFMFNKAPVVVRKQALASETQEKFRKQKRKQILKDKKQKFVELDSDEDPVTYSLGKRQLQENDIFDDQEGTFFQSMKYDFSSYFMLNKTQLGEIDKVPNMKLKEGAYILGAISEKGPNSRYLEVSLGRTNKAYITNVETCEDDQKADLQNYKIGEYVQCVVMPNINPRNLQLSLRPSQLNKTLNFEDIFPGMTLQGTVLNEEDFGYKINFFTKDRCTGFFKTEDVQLLENKCYMFTVVSTDPKKKLLLVSLHNPQAVPQVSMDQEDMLGLDLSNLVKPGNLVNCFVTKILQNGLIVKFNRVFFGYIFEDYLAEPLETYKIKQKFNARIILADIPNKQINLSQKQHHIEFTEIEETQRNFIAPGQTFETGFTIKKCLFGGSYIVSFENQGHQELEGFIHSQHIEEEQDKLKEGIKIEKPFKIKEINYFDQYPVLTSQKSILQKRNVLWNQLTVGDIHKGTIISIKQTNEQYQLMVALGDNVKGMVDHLNIQDVPSQQLPKYIKEGRKLMVRILSVDSEFKKLKLTLKQSFIKEKSAKKDIENEDEEDSEQEKDGDEEERILSDFENIVVGTKYQGYIVKALDFGFLVSFFNNITGLLTFKDLEDVNKLNRKNFKLGQTLKVFVTFVNKEEKKIGLSYSSKGINNHQISNQVHKKLASTLSNIPSLAEADPEFKSKLSEVKIGDIFEYIIDKKATESQSDCLILKLRNEKKSHKAILTVQHLSDYAEHYDALFEYYKTSQANPKIKAIIIGIQDNGYALISTKPSLLEQKQYTSISQLKKGVELFGYADYQTSKGIIVKLNENFKGFAQLSEEEATSSKINFGDSLMLHVRKIDGEKLYFTLCKKQQVHHTALPFKPFLGFLREEFIINRKFINQNPKKWQKYKIGNYIQGKVSLVKEYGIILNITNTQEEQTNITGFITNENLQSVQKKNLKTDQILTCQILDIDYEQEILDLVCAPKAENTDELLKHHSYNLELIKKTLLAKKHNNDASVSCQVLLKKENYSILKAPENYFIIAEQKIINEQNKEDEEDDEEEEQSEKKQQKTVQIKFINLSIVSKNCGDINAYNKSNYLPVAEIVPQQQPKKQQEKSGKMEVESSEQDPSIKKISKALLSKLKIGGVVTGTVKNVKATNVTLQISEKVFAKLHKNLMEPGTTYKAGQEVTAKIVSIKKEQHLQIEITTLKAHLKLPSEQLCDRLLLPEKSEDFAEKYQDQVLKGVIKSVNTNSIHPLYVEFSNNHLGHVTCFTGIVDLQDKNFVSQLEKVKNLKQNYKPGQQLDFYIRECTDIKNMEVSLVKSVHALDIGAVRIAKVCGTSGTRKIRVQLDDQIFGSVDVVEVSDEWLANPLAKYQKNDLVPIRILNENSKGEFDCSMRESMLNKNNWEKALSPTTGTTLNFKKMFSEQQTNGDLRSRVYKVGQGSLKTGMLVIGYVNECNTNGCYIKIAYNLAARAQLNELSDENIPNPQAYFYKNKLVLARIIKVKEDGKVDVSLRESVIVHGYSLDITKLKTGMTVQGIVTGHKQGKALVQIQKCKYSAKLSRKDHEVSEEQESITYFEAILKKGTAITAKIKKIKLEPYPKITLATQKQYFEGEDKMEQENEKEEKTEQQENVEQLIESIKEIVAQNVEQEKKSSDIQLSLLKQQEEEEAEQEYEEFDEEDSDEEELQKDILEKFANKDNEEQESGDSEEELEEEDEDEEEEEEEGDSDDIKSDQSVIEGDDVEEDEQITNKKKSRRQKELQKRKKEEKIREQEQKLLNENALPETKDDFEKLILKNPNSSFVWIKYMAHAMQQGIEEARTVADRALKVINFRNETEKLNVWTAYMNLEHNFGTEKELISVFQRATQSCKPKLVYFRLIEIYKKSEKYDLLFELARQMIKKFKHSSKVWLEYMKTIADIKDKQQEGQNNQYDLKEILKRSLQCLKKKKHIIIMSHYARLMFANNEPEKGRTTFDAILSNYPKRTDIWAVFLDMETKFGTPQTTRNLYERCINMSFKPRKMKFFFKRYLQYELQYGSNEKAEIVKQKAQEYVQSLIENDDDEDKQQQDNEIEEQNNEEQGDQMDEEKEE